MIRDALLSLLGQRFWIGAWLAMAAGLWWPGDLAWLRPTVPWCLGGILFFSCLRLGGSDIRAGLASPSLRARLLAILALKILVVPWSFWLAARALAPAWADGLLLTWLAPASLSTVALADVLGGHRVLALAFVAATNLLAPLVLPLGVLACGSGNGGAGETAGRIGYVVLLLVVPFTASQLTRAALPVLVQRGTLWWGRLSVLSMLLLAFAATAAARGDWQGWPMAALLEPLLVCTLVCLAGCTIGIASRMILPPDMALSFTIGLVFMNNGLAIAYVTRFFPGQPGMSLPVLLTLVPALPLIAMTGRILHPAARPAVPVPPPPPPSESSCAAS